MWNVNPEQLKAELNQKAKYLIVRADVRYWEDAKINGVEDSNDAPKMPLIVGGTWSPVIRLQDGQILHWPEGTTADVHYKVCDAGEYFLSDEGMGTIAKRNGYYVPDDLLCIGDNGHGDYIILKIGADGKIEGWQKPDLDPKDWRHPHAPEPEDD